MQQHIGELSNICQYRRDRYRECMQHSGFSRFESVRKAIGIQENHHK